MLGMAAAACLLWGMTINGGLDVVGTLTAGVVNFGGSTSTQPNKTGAVAPATCSVGQTFFNSGAAAGSNLQLCTAPNTWTAVTGGSTATTALDPTDPSWMVHKEEFMTLQASASSGTAWVVGENMWESESISGSGFYTQFQTSVYNDPNGGPKHPGQWKFGSGATNGVAANLKFAPYATESHWLDGNRKSWKFVWVFRLGTVTQQTLWIGATRDLSSLNPNNYIAVKYDATTTAANFQLAAGMYGGTAGTYDTGITADTTTWHTFVARGDDNVAAKVWMSLDGGAEKSFCLSGCDVTASVSGIMLSSGVKIGNKEAADKYVVLDYYGAKSLISATGTRQ